MKRAFCALAALFLVLVLSPGARCVGEELYDAPLDALQSALPDAHQAIEQAAKGDLGQALGTLWDSAFGAVKREFAALVRGAAAVFAVCLLCALVRAFSPGHEKLIALCGAAGLLGICLDELGGALTIGAQCLSELSAFGKLLLPTLCAAHIMSGAVSAAGTLYTAALFVCDTLLSSIGTWLSPAVWAYCALACAQCVSGNEGLGKLARLYKSGVILALKLLLGAFTGYLALSGVLSGAANAVAVKSAKLASGTVPLVGSVLSDAAETVVAGAAAVKSVIGAAGLAGIAAIVCAPFLRLALTCALYKAAAVLSAMAGAGETAAFAENLSEGFTLALALCAGCTLLVILSVFMAILGALRV